MATNRSGPAQRPNGAPQTKVCQFKLVLLGESAVGKSSLVLRFVKGQFHEYQESTIGAAFLTQTVCLDDTTVKFEIWDTAGQERFVLCSFYLILAVPGFTRSSAPFGRSVMFYSL